MNRARMLCFVLGFAVPALAVPPALNYQGSLTRLDGTPLDTTVAMTFSLYVVPAGGSAVWTETYPAVTVAGGLFNVSLGSLNPLSDQFTADRWLGVTVGGDSEMSPRPQVLAAAYAFRVGTVDGALGGVIIGDVGVNGKGRMGQNNTNDGQGAFVAGQSSHADGTYSSVTGGTLNWALGGYAHVGGGQQNRAGDMGGANYQTVGGGVQNSATGWAATVAGGAQDSASGQYTVIGGGSANIASGLYGTVGGGQSNRATGRHSVIGGGIGNAATDSLATIAGGWLNAASGYQSTISGGQENVASDYITTVAGGNFNHATSAASTVSGGQLNTASGFVSTVGGGIGNTVTGAHAVVAGGYSNTAGGDRATIAGGHTNQTMGNYATVAGGIENIAQGTASFAAGYRAFARHPGSFVWSSTGVGTDSTVSFGTFTFTARCSGGARFYTTQTGTGVGVELPGGTGAWSNLCDVNQKRLYGGVNTNEILQRVAALPLYRWSYRTQDPGIQHIGPTAQDFYAAFGLGENDTHISTLDPDGVALAAIQELARENTELKERLARLETQLQALTEAK